MENKVIFKDLGSINYKEAWDYQKNLFQQILELKKYNEQLPICEQNVNYNYLLFCEHPHVYTIGKSGSENNLLVNKDTLGKQGVQLYKIDRGGDITYHGPGQIVGYPIFNLEAFALGVKQYIFKLEESIIQTLANYGIQSGRLKGVIGVWLDPDDPSKARKICAIGVKASRYVSMHGFAFNVNTNLTYYKSINPCGFIDKGVTSMQKELGKDIDIEEVKQKLLKSFERVFNFRVEDF
ncbi:MAG: lipoyl(octanoyl) transferase LipB [Bacteroidales bacterium]|nr:lipoyl(octanoyl) transferase LipB [Bacteroidales bacterium]